MEKQELMQPTETVKRTATITVPVKVDNILKFLSELTNLSVEEMLCSELYEILQQFYQGGFLEGWIDYAFKHGDLDKTFELIGAIDC